MNEQRYPTSRGHVKVQYRRQPNFLERLGSSLVGSVLGFLLVVGACVLLFWNEVGSVCVFTAKHLSSSVSRVAACTRMM